jgi:NAD(P)-dependent dehydrogenase (short-subunit alcohol dehydrogenase family)
VLNIGSVLAHCGQANMLAYSMSKGALMTMTRNLADSLGMDRVRVNQLNVGWTLSDNEYQVKIGDGLGEGWPERLPAHVVPMGRLLMPRTSPPPPFIGSVAKAIPSQALWRNWSSIPSSAATRTPRATRRNDEIRMSNDELKPRTENCEPRTTKP